MKRSNQANNYYWAVVVAEALKFYEANPAELYHDVSRCLKEDEPAQVIHSLFKILFNGNHTTRFEDDAEATGVQKMTAYIDKIREFFYHQHKWDIPPSNTEKINLTNQGENQCY